MRLIRVIPLFLTAFLLPFSASAGSAGTDDLFRVQNLLVRGQGQTSIDARKRGFELAHVAALREVVSRLTNDPNTQSLPLPPLDELVRLVDEVEVRDQRMTDSAYVALMDLTFKPDALKRYLSESNVTYAVAQAKPLLVIPELRIRGSRLLWDSRNVWASAWRHDQFKSGLQPFLVPEGTPEQAGLVDLNTPADLLPSSAGTLAISLDASGVLMMTAELVLDDSNAMRSAEIDVRRIGGSSGPPSMQHSEPARAEDSPRDLLLRAAAKIAAVYREAWKQGSQVDGNQIAKLQFESQLTDLTSWFGMEARLNSIGQIEAIDLQSLGDNAAVAEITFRGSLDQLITAMAQQNLELIPGAFRYLLADLQ